MSQKCLAPSAKEFWASLLIFSISMVGWYPASTMLFTARDPDNMQHHYTVRIPKGYYEHRVARKTDTCYWVQYFYKNGVSIYLSDDLHPSFGIYAIQQYSQAFLDSMVEESQYRVTVNMPQNNYWIDYKYQYVRLGITDVKAADSILYRRVLKSLHEIKSIDIWKR